MWSYFREPLTTYELAHRHFGKLDVAQLTILERTFPYRVRADLQRSVEQLLQRMTVKHACAVYTAYHQTLELSQCLTRVERHIAPRLTPPQYQEVDIGEDQPVRCLSTGIWMVESEGHKLAMLLTPAGNYCQVTGVRFEFAGRNVPEVHAIIDRAFRQLEIGVNEARSYRGKILSLEQDERNYTGRSSGIRVHRLRSIGREQIVLPMKTMTLLDRNVIGFMKRRAELRQRCLSTRKGLLFYGPPGTGKTHCIHYLTQVLPDTTTLIITADQVALLEEYMTLARLLQPSIVVIEDVDLIARNRERMNSASEEALLNRLLNHMDGLKEDAEILFVLTTNRPEMLEPALTGRPGRIDQAIEFPLPDDDGRRQLVAMYAGGVTVPHVVVEVIVRKTAGVSAAFIKELMRRAYQFHLEQNGAGELTTGNVDAALEEMLFQGGSLNRALLGATGVPV